MEKTFHAFTITHSGIANRIVTEVGLSEVFDINQVKNGEIPVNVINKKAVWDTGATKSVISKETANELHLTPIGSSEVYHFGGKEQCNSFLVNIYLPNKVGMVGILVSECPSIVNSFDVLIGMDIISRGDFSITNVDDKTFVSYRVPSISHIDYVLEANEINNQSK